MPRDFRTSVKRTLSRYPLFARWVAEMRARVLGLLAAPYRLRYWPRAVVPLSVKLIGIRRIAIGRNSVIGARSWLNVNDMHGNGTALEIGDHCFIGMENFFSVGERIRIGDYCLTARHCAFVGATHVYDDPMQPYMCTGVTKDGVIRVGVNCFFGLGAQVVGNVSIGHGCVIGAGAVVREDIPPFSLVVGSPARIIKRFDFAKNTWVAWPTRDYVEGPDEATYRAALLERNGAPVHHVSAAAGLLRDIA